MAETADSPTLLDKLYEDVTSPATRLLDYSLYTLPPPPPLFVKRNGVYVMTDAARPATAVSSKRLSTAAKAVRARSTHQQILTITSAPSEDTSASATDGSSAAPAVASAPPAAVTNVPDLLAKFARNTESVPSLNPRKLRREAKKNAPKTAGPGWFDLPSTELTPEVKTDLKMIEMRAYMDPKHFFKRDRSRLGGGFVQIGKVIEGPGEFYSARIPRKERGNSIVDQILKDRETRRFLKRKHDEIAKKRKPLPQRQRPPILSRKKGASTKRPKKKQKIERF